VFILFNSYFLPLASINLYLQRSTAGTLKKVSSKYINQLTSPTSACKFELCQRRRVVETCLEFCTIQLQAQLFRVKVPPPPRLIDTYPQIYFGKPLHHTQPYSMQNSNENLARLDSVKWKGGKWILAEKMAGTSPKKLTCNWENNSSRHSPQRAVIYSNFTSSDAHAFTKKTFLTNSCKYFVANSNTTKLRNFTNCPAIPAMSTNIDNAHNNQN